MKKKTKNLRIWIIRHKWLILLGVVIFPFILNYTVAQQVWPYWKVAGDASIWIGFWGSYVSAIGTVIMAVIAIETLQFSRQQSKPRVYPSLEKVVQKQYDEEASDEAKKWFNEELYCLRITNYGIEPATGIRIRVNCSNPELFNNEEIANKVNWLNNVEFALGPKEEKVFYLCPAEITPQIRRKELKDKKSWFDSFIKSFMQSLVLVELSYDEDESAKPKLFSFPVNGVLTAQTTMIQVLGDINRNLQKLHTCQDKKEHFEDKDTIGTGNTVPGTMLHG